MYKLPNLKLPIDFDKNNIKKYLSDKLKINTSSISYCELDKLSIDAREKSNIHYVANILFGVNTKLNISRYKNVSEYSPSKKEIKKWSGGDKKIVIVGSGPSGLFAGLELCNSGANVTIIERGYEMDKRISAVDRLMNDGVLDEKSNIQFGEGGAGTFSDGKLNTGTKSGYNSQVLDTFCQFGASKEILYTNRPHVGTDVLSKVIVNIREYMKSKGSTFLFEHKLVGINNSNGVDSIIVETPDGEITMPCDILILAIGHSSRDTIRNLNSNGISFKQKAFSLGYRIEHLQKDIDYSQYGEVSLRGILPPADYHLATHLENGRVVYTFCMCPGGVVVPATSENGHVVTNGMSYSKRDGVNANSAVLVSVTPEDFPSSHALSGIDLQEEIESKAYSKNNSFLATVQRVGDFLDGVKTTKLGKVFPTYKPGFKLGSVEDILPDNLTTSLKLGIIALDSKLKGFADTDAILTGVETRSSAPYQVIRKDNMETDIPNVYMVGEGAGFAGGIVSSAVEGIKVANILLDKYNISDKK